MARTLAVVSLLLLGAPAAAQERKGDKEESPKVWGTQAPEALAEKAKADTEQLLSLTYYYCWMILCFGAAVIVGVGVLAWNQRLGETSTLRLIALVALATMASMLIAAGFSQTQIGPVLTLLGTLAGYIFARAEQPHQTTPPPTPPTP